MRSLKKTVNTLVLHRVVAGLPEHWEDITLENFSHILNLVRQQTIGAISPSVYLTFDDGCISDYDLVFPKLCDAGLSASFFIITDKIGSAGYLSRAQIREMYRHNMTMGSHTASHRRLTKLSIAQAVADIVQSKGILEDITGSEVTQFSFPFGDYNSEILKAVEEIGFSSIFTSNHGLDSELYGIRRRNSINCRHDPRAIKGILQPSYFKRVEWYIEDSLKGIVKNSVGSKNYTRVRNLLK